MSDTDSYAFQVFCEDIFKDMCIDKEKFDFSEYDKDHPI